MKKNRGLLIRGYFAKFPRWTLYVSLISILTTLHNGILYAYGLPILVLFMMIAIIAHWTKRPSDQQYDEWQRESISRLKHRALIKNGLDQSELIREPVHIIGLQLKSLGGADFHVKRGKDKKIRFTPVHVAVINFTQHYLCVYQCILDMTTENALNEQTDEYFYRDIVSVATQSKSMTVDTSLISSKIIARLPENSGYISDGKLQLNSAEQFSLTTSGGTSIKVLLKDPVLIKSAGGGTISTQDADHAVQSVRKMLREKKTA